jgi:acyl carrier protein
MATLASAAAPPLKSPRDAQVGPSLEGTRIEIEGRLKKVAINHLGVDGSKVTENAKFIDDLGADSLDLCELTIAFEEEFGLEIPGEAAEKMVTVKDAVEFLTGHRCGRSP